MWGSSCLASVSETLLLSPLLPVQSMRPSQRLEKRNPGPELPGVMLPSSGAEIFWPWPKGWQALPASSPTGREL